MDMCDTNKDGALTLEEVLANHEVFLDSDATEYGQQLRWAHDELWALVFLFLIDVARC